MPWCYHGVVSGSGVQVRALSHTHSSWAFSAEAIGQIHMPSKWRSTTNLDTPQHHLIRMRTSVLTCDVVCGVVMQFVQRSALTCSAASCRPVRAGSAPCRCTGGIYGYPAVPRCLERSVEDGRYPASSRYPAGETSGRRPRWHNPAYRPTRRIPGSLAWGFTVQLSPKCRCRLPPLFQGAESFAFPQVSTSQHSNRVPYLTVRPRIATFRDVGERSKPYSVLTGVESRFEGLCASYRTGPLRVGAVVMVAPSPARSTKSASPAAWARRSPTSRAGGGWASGAEPVVMLSSRGSRICSDTSASVL